MIKYAENTQEENNHEQLSFNIGVFSTTLN